MCKECLDSQLTANTRSLALTKEQEQHIKVRLNGEITTFSGELGMDRVIAQIEMYYAYLNKK